MKNLYLSFLLIPVCCSVAIAQCDMDRHSTNFFDGWISCEAAASPNPLRPESHFILYDFGSTYKLGQTQIWNTNDPAHLDWGMRDVAIDYSLDGQTWTHAGDFIFEQGTGSPRYEGFEGPDLNDIEARYLLITALSNYGGDCYGMSEIKIQAEEVIISNVEDLVDLLCVDVSLFPNPFTDQITVTLGAECTGDLHYVLYDASGKIVLTANRSLISGQRSSFEIGRHLPSGAYRLRIEYGGQSIHRNLIKINRT